MSGSDYSHGTTAQDGFGDSPTQQRELTAAIVWGSPDYRQPILWLTRREETIGRDPECSVRLPSVKLSRLHAKLRAVGKMWMLEDLQSRNGVFVNGERIENTVLSPGDIVRVGEWVGTFTELPASDAAPFLELDGALLCGPRLQVMLARAHTLARSELPVIIQGETGTGKELFAKAIHAASGRGGPFIAVNCSGYQRTTASAELFGYRRGAFTGAERAHTGHIQAAHGGTLFLDEIADLDLEVQAQLLRVVQEGEVLPLGESRPVRVDVRFLAATQVPLAQRVEEGRFREDLRARLEGAVLALPPLRERREEIGALFHAFARRELGEDAANVDSRLVEYLCRYDWPLNVRQLALLVRKLAVLHRAGAAWSLEALRDELPEVAPQRERTPEPSSIPKRELYNAEEVRALLDALQASRGNITHAAAKLNITRQRAYRMLKYAREREE